LNGCIVVVGNRIEGETMTRMGGAEEEEEEEGGGGGGSVMIEGEVEGRTGILLKVIRERRSRSFEESGEVE